jgi:CubicO group peptidase (beta-lactamase class C family)
MRRGVALPLLLVVVLSCQRNKEPLSPEGGITSTEWQVVDPAGQGMDRRLMSKGYLEAHKLGYVDGLLVQRNGVLISEMYFNGFNGEKPHIVHSVSKSILSAMIGIAIDKRLLSLNDLMVTYLADYDLSNLESRKSEITILNLLTMKAGYDSDEMLYETIAGSANWVQKTLDTPLKYNPGEKFSYLTFCSHLLSAILTKASGQSSLEFGARNLFTPLNITCKGWDRDPQGIYFGGNNMYFLPCDLVTFGQMFLDGGKANGRQIVPSAWVEESTKPFYAGFKQWGSLQNPGYGYQWWSGTLSGHPVVFALGHGGQYILLVPDIHLIAVTTAIPPYSGDYWNTADEQERAILGILDTCFIQAAF